MTPPITLAPEVVQTIPAASAVLRTVPGGRDLVQRACANMTSLPVVLDDEGHYMDDKGSFEEVWNDED